MSFDPITAAMDLGKMAIARIWPDPVKQAEEERKLLELSQNGDIAQLNAKVQLLLGQMKINEKEAEHKSIFVAGWRPFIGWVGGAALAYNFVVYPLMLWGWAIGAPIGVEAPPMVEAGELYTIILGMLGIAATRSYDKSKGTATQSIGKK